MAIVRVAVIEKDNGGLVVDPPTAFLEPGDEFRVINHASVDVTAAIPGSVLTGPASKKIRAGNKGSLGKANSMPGKHDYSVSTATGRQALGHSDPVIIIDVP